MDSAVKHRMTWWIGGCNLSLLTFSIQSPCARLWIPFPRDLSIDLAILNAAKLGEIKDMVQVSLADLRHTMEINLWANKVY